MYYSYELLLSEIEINTSVCKTVADAIKFMNGEFSQPQVTNSNMAEINPDGFTARVIVTPVMWAVE